MLSIVFVVKREYGTTPHPRLSASMSPFCIYMVVNLPPSSADSCKYVETKSSRIWIEAFSVYHGMVNLDSVYLKVHASYFLSQLHANPFRRLNRAFQRILHR